MSLMVIMAKSYAEISIEMSVDKNSLSPEEELQLQISVRGANSLSNAPQIIGLENFEVTSQSSGQSIKLINGTMSVEKNFYYTLVPKKVGTFKLGPVSIEVEGSPVQSNSVEIEVSASGNNADVADATDSTNTNREDQNSKKGYFAQATVNTKTPIINQQIVYTFRFFERVGISNANISKSPTFEGFVKEELGEQRRFQTVINGLTWNVAEIKFALFPNKLGNLTLTPTELVATVVENGGNARSRRGSIFDEFFGSMQKLKQVTIKTESIDLVVSPLPSEGRPAKFSGSIGKFSINGQVSKNSLAVGESATLTLTVTGMGNVRDITFPNLSFEDFKIYEDKPVVELQSDKDVVVGRKTFKYGLVPQKEGLLTISPIEFFYFNPNTKQYEVTKTEAISLQISKSVDEKLSLVQGESAKIEDQRKSITLLGEDLMPLKRNGGVMNFLFSPITFFEIVLLGILSFMPLIIFIFLYLLTLRKQRYEEDKGLLRKTKAYKNFKNRVDSFKKGQIKIADLSNIFRAYLGDRLNFDGMALTPIDVEKKLKDKVSSADLILSVKELLSLFEFGSYGGEVSTSISELLKQSTALVKRLEKEIR